jgi:uncharacterized protein YqjF (DUF2071 family)
MASALPLRAAAALATFGEELIRPLGVVFDEIPGQRRTLEEVDYRPWPVPQRPWLMGQTWRDLLFAHWQVAADDMRALVPEPLELDEYDGSAWLGITPFAVTGLRPRGAPPPPAVSSFLELNVRTYVRFEDRPGIFFFSLDCTSAAAVAAARRGYLLPYFRAQASAGRRGERVRFDLGRVTASEARPAVWRGTYWPTGPRLSVTDVSLERWLTERYCLYVVRDGRVLRGDIHHPPWPLQPSAAEIDENTIAAPLGIELGGEPRLHFAARQDTLFWALEEVAGSSKGT